MPSDATLTAENAKHLQAVVMKIKNQWLPHNGCLDGPCLGALICCLNSICIPPLLFLHITQVGEHIQHTSLL